MAQLQTPMHPPCMSSSESFHKTELDARFVGWTPGPEKEVLNTAPRLHQKKSRTGCQQYRARRVKCNKIHPMCGSCVRHKTQQQNGCGIAIPHLAFKQNSLLYSIYALHLVKLEPNNPEHVATYQRYLSHTLREHRDEVNSLNRSNADAACITLFYLHMSRTTGLGPNIEAWNIFNTNNSIMCSMIPSAPGMNPGGWLREEAVCTHPSKSQEFSHLLRRTASDILSEPWLDPIRHRGGRSSSIDLAPPSSLPYDGAE
ncbi:uncharacterized protein RSE6_07163 [Rhynchosporium secalis]|uniref:Zn(2)-C6 fungal-type domain-containing protein n=1 Tax=Rhynchosporium secalis TaxID=38038 RepID=A0A1E1MC57_RHYSE|nr:uncharacterized protein RSE6_07163 [Rhynchosporium secalis]